jgi:hypothetical protein
VVISRLVRRVPDHAFPLRNALSPGLVDAFAQAGIALVG